MRVVSSRGLKRLGLAIAAPLLVFAAAEGLLRLFGHGHPGGFLIPLRVAGRPALVDNQFYTRRFFPGEMARTPEAIVLDAKKPHGTIRVAVLGESAAAGEPAQEFGMPRQLQAILDVQFPSQRVEVINAAVTAVNTPIILDIARDVKRCEPDAFVLYIGNNEVVGPFGPGFVLRAFTGSRWYARASMWATSTRLGQALRHLYERQQPDRDRMRMWGGLEMFQNHEVHPDDPRLQDVYRNFAANMEELLRVTSRGGTPVILSTMAVNLRDGPPFSSPHSLGLTAPDAAACERHCAAARDALGRKTYSEALAESDAALAIDAGYALGHFLRAASLDGLGKYDEALSSYVLARDRDALRFRADGRINRATADVAAAWKGNVVFIDAEKLMNDAGGRSAAGDDVFWDHVHLNFHGNYLLARAVASALTPILGERVGAAPGACPPEAYCAERLAFTPIEDWLVQGKMVRRFERPPFSMQFDHASRLAQRTDAWEKLGESIDAGDRSQWLEAYRRVAAEHPRDWIAQKLYADRLLGEGRIPESLQQADAALALVPHRVDMRGEVSRLHAFAGNTDAALRVIRESPFRDAAAESRIYFYVGGALLDAGRPADAVPFFREAAAHESVGLSYRLHLATALRDAGRLDEAEALFRRLYDPKKPDLDAVRGLAMCVMSRGNWAEAVELLEKTAAGDDANDQWNLAMARQRRNLEIDPTDLHPHLQLGRLHMDRGLYEQAEYHFRRALRSPETAGAAYQGLGQTHMAAGRWADARQWLIELGDMESENAAVLNDVAWQLSTHPEPAMRDAASATKFAWRARELTGGTNAVILDTLAASQALAGDLSAAASNSALAFQIAESHGDTNLAERIRRRHESYLSGSSEGLW